ncbi:MAG TPA: HAMP domain-containing protein [Ktedonobacteraceae bacterium]
MIVLPFALVSYLIMRRTTRRLRALAMATGVLRGGAYSRRVHVEGEDELGLLQADFNAMAKTVQDLQK